MYTALKYWTVTVYPEVHRIMFQKLGQSECKSFRLESPAINSLKQMIYSDISSLGIIGDPPCLTSDDDDTQAPECVNTDFMKIRDDDDQYRAMKNAANCDAVRQFIENNQKLKDVVIDKNTQIVSLSFGHILDRKASKPSADYTKLVPRWTVEPMGRSVRISNGERKSVKC
jgi:hypothetical protein